MATDGHACHTRPGYCANCGERTTRGRTCSPACARAWADNHLWGSARIAALARAGWACESCGLTDWETELQVHHLDPVDLLTGYMGASCAHHQANLQVLCARVCHRAAHAALRTKPGDQLRLLVSA